MSLWQPFFPFMRREQRPLSMLAVLALLDILVGLSAPWPLKLIVDNAVGSEELPGFFGWLRRLPAAHDEVGLAAWLAGSTVLLFALRQGIILFTSLLQAKSSNRLTYRVSTEIFDRVQHASRLDLERQTSGDLVRRITEDAACARTLLFGVAFPGLFSAITIIAMSVIMLRMNWVMASLAIGAGVPVFALIRYYTGRMRLYARESADQLGAMSSQIEQVLSNIRLVKASGRESHEAARLREISDRVYSANLSQRWTEARLNGSNAMVTAVASSGLILLGGFAVVDAALSLGELLIFLAYMAAFYGPLVVTHEIAGTYAMAAAAAERATTTLSIAPAVVEASAPVRFPDSPKSISFRDVSFGYRDDRPVLSGLSLQVDAGEQIALIGRSGSGKSTIADLVIRLFDPWSGEISISGVNLKEISARELRANVSLVQQDAVLLPISIADNISYGTNDATAAQIEAAARAAHIHEFIIQLPDGYNSIVGEQGATLSGGERQRIAVARALLKDAPIVILDEPTSSLDSESERLVMDSIQRLTVGRTTLVISHNSSTLFTATRVVAIDHGAIIGEWSRDELAAQGLVIEELIGSDSPSV